jgi:superfamily II DNA helicase RecQ
MHQLPGAVAPDGHLKFFFRGAMSWHFFSIPAINGKAEQDVLNHFCASHAVVAVEQQLVQAGLASFWAVAVTLRDHPGALPNLLAEKKPEANRATSKVDYKEILNEADFAVFSGLRELRKQTALQEGVAVYAVFTNEQLAAMVTQRVATLNELRDIEGVGEGRTSKYGALFLRQLQKSFANNRVD